MKKKKNVSKDAPAVAQKRCLHNTRLAGGRIYVMQCYISIWPHNFSVAIVSCAPWQEAFARFPIDSSVFWHLYFFLCIKKKKESKWYVHVVFWVRDFFHVSLSFRCKYKNICVLNVNMWKSRKWAYVDGVVPLCAFFYIYTYVRFLKNWATI